MVSAIAAKPAPMSNCMATIQERLVFRMSTIGLQSGLMTHGRYSQLVYNAMSVFEMPSRLYMTTETVITAT